MRSMGRTHDPGPNSLGLLGKEKIHMEGLGMSNYLKDALIGTGWGLLISIYPAYEVFSWVVESRSPVVEMSAGLLL